MEGIVPYIPSGVHAIQLGVLNPSDCGRLVAAPTGVLGRVPFDRGCPPERDDVGIVPYIPSGCVPFNRECGIRQGADVGRNLFMKRQLVQSPCRFFAAGFMILPGHKNSPGRKSPGEERTTISQ